MRKIQSKKQLFIDELEIRRSSSPLIVQTMAIGEAGTVSNDRSGKTSQDSLVKGQKVHENLIKVKNVADKTGRVTVTTTAVGEEGVVAKYALPKPSSVTIKYAPPKPIHVTTTAVGEEGVVAKYAPPKPIHVTTTAVGEEGVVAKYALPKPSSVPIKDNSGWRGKEKL